MDLYLNLLVLLPPPVSQPPFVHDICGGTVQMPHSYYELALAVWGGGVALTSSCHPYTVRIDSMIEYQH